MNITWTDVLFEYESQLDRIRRQLNYEPEKIDFYKGQVYAVQGMFDSLKWYCNDFPRMEDPSIGFYYRGIWYEVEIDYPGQQYCLKLGSKVISGGAFELHPELYWSEMIDDYLISQKFPEFH